MASKLGSASENEPFAGEVPALPGEIRARYCNEERSPEVVEQRNAALDFNGQQSANRDRDVPGFPGARSGEPLQVLVSTVWDGIMPQVAQFR